MEHPMSPLLTQLAFCYELGFGCQEDNDQPKPFEYEEIQIRLRQAINSEPASPKHVALCRE